MYSSSSIPNGGAVVCNCVECAAMTGSNPGSCSTAAAGREAKALGPQMWSEFRPRTDVQGKRPCPGCPRDYYADGDDYRHAPSVAKVCALNAALAVEDDCGEPPYTSGYRPPRGEEEDHAKTDDHYAWRARTQTAINHAARGTLLMHAALKRPGDDAANRLYAACGKARLPQPTYEYVMSGTSHNPVFYCTATFLGRQFEGFGHTKAVAKDRASQAILDSKHGTPLRATERKMPDGSVQSKDDGKLAQLITLLECPSLTRDARYALIEQALMFIEKNPGPEASKGEVDVEQWVADLVDSARDEAAARRETVQTQLYRLSELCRYASRVTMLQGLDDLTDALICYHHRASDDWENEQRQSDIRSLTAGIIASLATIEKNPGPVTPTSTPATTLSAAATPLSAWADSDDGYVHDEPLPSLVKPAAAGATFVLATEAGVGTARHTYRIHCTAGALHFTVDGTQVSSLGLEWSSAVTKWLASGEVRWSEGAFVAAWRKQKASAAMYRGAPMVAVVTPDDSVAAEAFMNAAADASSVPENTRKKARVASTIVTAKDGTITETLYDTGGGQPMSRDERRREWFRKHIRIIEKAILANPPSDPAVRAALLITVQGHSTQFRNALFADDVRIKASKFGFAHVNGACYLVGIETNPGPVYKSGTGPVRRYRYKGGADEVDGQAMADSMARTVGTAVEIHMPDKSVPGPASISQVLVPPSQSWGHTVLRSFPVRHGNYLGADWFAGRPWPAEGYTLEEALQLARTVKPVDDWDRVAFLHDLQYLLSDMQPDNASMLRSEADASLLRGLGRVALNQAAPAPAAALQWLVTRLPHEQAVEAAALLKATPAEGQAPHVEAAGEPESVEDDHVKDLTQDGDVEANPGPHVAGGAIAEAKKRELVNCHGDAATFTSGTPMGAGPNPDFYAWLDKVFNCERSRSLGATARITQLIWEPLYVLAQQAFAGNSETNAFARTNGRYAITYPRVRAYNGVVVHGIVIEPVSGSMRYPRAGTTGAAWSQQEKLLVLGQIQPICLGLRGPINVNGADPLEGAQQAAMAMTKKYFVEDYFIYALNLVRLGLAIEAWRNPQLMVIQSGLRSSVNVPSANVVAVVPVLTGLMGANTITFWSPYDWQAVLQFAQDTGATVGYVGGGLQMEEFYGGVFDAGITSSNPTTIAMMLTYVMMIMGMGQLRISADVTDVAGLPITVELPYHGLLRGGNVAIVVGGLQKSAAPQNIPGWFDGAAVPAALATSTNPAAPQNVYNLSTLVRQVLFNSLNNGWKGATLLPIIEELVSQTGMRAEWYAAINWYGGVACTTVGNDTLAVIETPVDSLRSVTGLPIEVDHNMGQYPLDPWVVGCGAYAYPATPLPRRQWSQLTTAVLLAAKLSWYQSACAAYELGCADVLTALQIDVNGGLANTVWANFWRCGGSSRPNTVPTELMARYGYAALGYQNTQATMTHVVDITDGIMLSFKAPTTAGIAGLYNMPPASLFLNEGGAWHPHAIWWPTSADAMRGKGFEAKLPYAAIDNTTATYVIPSWNGDFNAVDRDISDILGIVFRWKEVTGGVLATQAVLTSGTVTRNAAVADTFHLDAVGWYYASDAAFPANFIPRIDYQDFGVIFPAYISSMQPGAGWPGTQWAQVRVSQGAEELPLVMNDLPLPRSGVNARGYMYGRFRPNMVAGRIVIGTNTGSALLTALGLSLAPVGESNGPKTGAVPVLTTTSAALNAALEEISDAVPATSKAVDSGLAAGSQI